MISDHELWSIRVIRKNKLSPTPPPPPPPTPQWMTRHISVPTVFFWKNLQPKMCNGSRQTSSGCSDHFSLTRRWLWWRRSKFSFRVSKHFYGHQTPNLWTDICAWMSGLKFVNRNFFKLYRRPCSHRVLISVSNNLITSGPVAVYTCHFELVFSEHLSGPCQAWGGARCESEDAQSALLSAP